MCVSLPGTFFPLPQAHQGYCGGLVDGLEDEYEAGDDQVLLQLDEVGEGGCYSKLAGGEGVVFEILHSASMVALQLLRYM
jgi:hypothetical protein